MALYRALTGMASERYRWSATLLRGEFAAPRRLDLSTSPGSLSGRRLLLLPVNASAMLNGILHDGCADVKLLRRQMSSFNEYVRV